MHEASHYRLLANRTWNDRLSNWLLAYPLLVTTQGYRRTHLVHHSHLNTDQDPDLNRKLERPEEWDFPKSRWALLGLLTRDILGGGFRDILGLILRTSRADTAPTPRRGWRAGRLLYYAGLCTIVILADYWLPVLLLWFLPAFTVLPALMRVRNIAEHFGLEGEQDLNMTRNTISPFWERAMLAPHNVGYHLDHHLCPSIPFYNLPALHRLLLRIPDYRAQAHQSDGYLGFSQSSVMAELTNRGVLLPRGS
jgi:fatty acid desaturase